MNLNPVFDKEIKRNSRSMRVSWVVFGCNLLLSGIAILFFFGKGSVQGFMRASDYGMPVKCYLLIAYALFLMLVLLIPGIAAGSISLEKEKKTLDVLLTTNLSPWKIIIGKLEASISMVVLMAISALPSVSLIMVYGGINLWNLFMMVLILVISGVFIGSIGIFCSVVFKRTTLATIMSYLLIIITIVGTVGLLWIVNDIVHLQETAGGFLGMKSVGPAIYLLLLNPLTTYFGLITMQVGSGNELMSICNLFGDYSENYIVSHMVTAGVFVQLVIAAVLLCMAAYFLNPLKNNSAHHSS